MPATLFDPSARPAPVGGGRRLTVSTSIAIHVIVVVLVVVIPLVGGVSMPAAMNRIDAFVAPPALPPSLPAQQPPAAQRAIAHNPNAAPITAPDSIAPEIDLPVPGVPMVEGGLPFRPGAGVPGEVLRPNVMPIMEPPPQKRPAPVRPGGKVEFPKRVSYVAPVYPPIAQSARIEGTVILEATIDENGAVVNLRVLKSIPLLDAAAKDAVSNWRYSPTTLNGVRVPLIMTVTVTFKLH